MATYTKNGARKFKLDNQKQALKQLNNFGDILKRMNELDQHIDKYEGIVTDSTIRMVAEEINREQKLKLTDEHISIVLRKYE